MYSVTIKESSRQLSPKEKVMVKDVTNAVALDKCVADSDTFEIKPDYDLDIMKDNQNLWLNPYQAPKDALKEYYYHEYLYIPHYF